jgi:hypothetical protein
MNSLLPASKAEATLEGCVHFLSVYFAEEK